jgi:hypothetical protein
MSFEYDLGTLALEFSPDGEPSRGRLTVLNTAVGDDQTFGARVDLDSVKSVSSFLKEAQALFPEAFPEDDLTLRRAMNELGIRVADDARVREAKAEEGEADEENAGVDTEEAEKLIADEGVLERYVEDMAQVHNVYGDRAEMKLVALGALSAQLEPPSIDKPAGTNVILIGESGRGKNYIADSVSSGLPEAFVYKFESASAKSFYYQADADPERFKHTWVYPNEAEATDHLVETLRPLLSKGSALHKTVDTPSEGPSTFRELGIVGPITVTIPTTRNKLDGQFQTRMLITELEDFEGRVPEHSAQVSKTFLADYAGSDHTSTLLKWRAALSTLTGVRRVVIPRMHEDFKVTTNEVSHGARLWRNFLSLMLTNAWLNQRNREIRTLDDGTEAVVANAEDYRVAYEVFKDACERSVANISDTHRKILNAVHKLEKTDKKGALRDAGFSLRQIGEAAGVSHELVRKNKAFLTASLGILYEKENGGLKLVKGADPSWWEKREFLKGFPRPENVCVWWEHPKGVDGVDSDENQSELPIDKPKKVSTKGLTVALTRQHPHPLTLTRQPKCQHLRLTEKSP